MRAQNRDQTLEEDTADAIILTSERDVATLRSLLREITEGPAFKGSHRSSQFLVFIVEAWIAGNVDQLKERLIGVHLFKRSPSYDTGEDAIVRVTASDVRKRLLQHYGWFGNDCEFRIDLPPGSYVPQIRRKSHGDVIAGEQPLPPPTSDIPNQGPDSQAILHQTQTPEGPREVVAPKKSWHSWQNAGILLGAAIFGWSLQWSGYHGWPASTSSALPWSAMFNSTATTHLVTSDPNIDVIQGVTQTDLSLSDYANHRYIPEPDKLTPEQARFCKTILNAESSAATPDLPITARIAEIAQTFSKKFAVQGSRSFQLSLLSNGDNFIFLGSPRSDPWFSLFANRLRFQFVYDRQMGSEFIRNLHAHPPEQETYVPSAKGGGTGYSFAIIAFIQNPDQNGQVLLLAGANGEGTAAAGDFVTDLPRISQALQNCGIAPSGPTRHFEILLRTETMAGVSRETDVMACHLIP